MDQPGRVPFLTAEDRAEVERVRSYLDRGEVPPDSYELAWDETVPGDRERAIGALLEVVYRERGDAHAA